ncbi:TIGR04282 family arsenosugar biosynthesis glycosyltransferase [Maridesulfovibrio sp.]|uniref:TIGR04282 family arsenosugar biosynthesis glycosyltransferase n=1 Tax=Maridesulfovibrio sp. TaxID=2795000 RepID=UPI003B001137
MSCAVIIFVKFPVAGKVKTRIGQDLGFETAAELYTAFVEDMLHNLESIGISPIIAFDPFQPEEKYRDWLGDRHYIPQHGENLGARMFNALQKVFKGGSNTAILTGSDLPDLDPEIVQQAMLNIKKAPACIGPASDGGYYLIGFQKDYLTKSIFENMEWSTERVFGETISRLKKINIKPAILSEHQDMDTIADLKRLAASPSNAHRCPKSKALLSTILQSRLTQN